jgi:hypothetical protein
VRLDEERAASTKKRALFSMRMWLWALVPVAAGVALLVVPKASQPPAAPPEAHAPALMEALGEAEADDLALASELELLADIEIVQRLQELEDFELLGDLDPAELDRLLAAEAAP